METGEPKVGINFSIAEISLLILLYIHASVKDVFLSMKIIYIFLQLIGFSSFSSELSLWQEPLKDIYSQHYSD